MSPQLQIKNLKPDVLIVGGGSAGIAAAVGASLTGSSVVLIEKNNYFGGNATASYVGTVCGLYYNGTESNNKYIAIGFPKSFAEALSKNSEYSKVQLSNGLTYLPYNRDAFIELSEQILNKYTETNYCNSVVTELIRSGNTVSQVHALINESPAVFHPKTIIDASGTSLFNAVDKIHDDCYQAAAHVFTLSGIKSDEEKSVSLSLIRTIKNGIDSGQISKQFEMISLLPGTLKNGTGVFKLGLPFKIEEKANTDNSFEAFSREAISNVHLYLKDNSELFKSSQIAFIAPETGVRTTSRNKGDYILTENDVLDCVKSEDSIARGIWPIEFWEPGKKVQLSFLPPNDYYDIPYQCLLSNNFSNLFFAGKNISATEQAIASARVIGTCLQTGFASGVLAGNYTKGKSVSESKKMIHKFLFAEFILL